MLDNFSTHKSKMVKDGISKCCPRTKLVFLLVCCPELNFIEVIWSLLQRQTINNSIFKYEQEIGQAMVSKWKNIYNKIMTKQSHIFYRGHVSLCLHSC